uniref:Xaa-Pro aminopeptidase 1 n=1 Tax=Aceria tosichella TaxID=561515 RepID=A0A6G1SPX4_9ACAR
MTSALPSGHLLEALRSLMKANRGVAGSLHAYVVPSGDAHQSEYIANCDMRRQFISKFTGSAGTAVVTLDKAALWTDGRYHLQATKQLEPTSWILMKDGLPDTPLIGDWLKDVLQSGNKVGVDPTLLSHESFKKLSKNLRTRDITLVPVEQNLVDLVWENKAYLSETDTPRPARPCNKVIKLDTDITGKDWTEKVKELREELKKKKCSGIVLTALDDIAWLLNLRGSDIDFNPVFFAYCIVTLKSTVLFIDSNKLTPEIRQSFTSADDHVELANYDEILVYIKDKLLTSDTADQAEGSIWLSAGSSEAIVSSIPKNRRFLQASPVTKAKAFKNAVEIKNMKNCHIRDGAALCEYLAWLEKTIEANPDGHEQLWEIPGADYLENCRKQQEHFMGLSFPSISGSGPNGAVIHYHPEEATKRPIGKKEMYLIDSGAQYLDGTTDVTRTVHFGQPTEKERECFTRVLKGHIQLARAVFPRLVKGNSLDTFARQYLWEQGLDYLHGTGHGVGMFLNVHEGPSSISPRGSPDDPGLDAGQILSNEPGYYEDGAFGIRIENLVVLEKAETKYNFNQRGFLKIDTITLVPIQLKMIDVNLMTDEEIEWLNNYHATCLDLVGQHLEKTGKHGVKQWLVEATKKLTR